MKAIYSKIEELFEKNQFAVLATLISTSGYSPREAGAKMLIMEDGSTLGSIGGGNLEYQLLQEAKKVFSEGGPLIFTYSPEETDGGEIEMHCGGSAILFLEPVSPDNFYHIQIFKKIDDLIRRGGSGILVTAVNADQWKAGSIPKMFMGSNGEKIGSILGIEELEDSLFSRMDRFIHQAGPETLICRDAESNQLDLFIEPIVSDPVLFIFGGGHVSSHIIPIVRRVGFKVIVIDDRPEIAEPANFPDAEEIYCYPYEGVMDRFDINESSYIVIVTRGHSHDKTVLAQALGTGAGYIGMIGSKRKIRIIYDKLVEEGFTAEDLERIHSPIGIEIGAETPEEIAISIVAELIKVRAGI
ncbi:MAG: XdhC family protein [Deltaproteobacteria bacterium]|nr:XdhC family protein [Deltaproteobacteria bacterium]